MKPGQKLAQPCSNPGPKTGRCYGEVYTAVRTHGARLGQFTWRDLCPPLTPAQAREALRCMRRSGELQILRNGTAGRFAKPALYTFTTAAEIAA